MTHHATTAGRPYVECDEGIDGVRCARRTFGVRDRFGDGPELGIWDLPRGWSVAPYPDDFDHGATRTSLLDGSPILPVPHEIGLFGDLHTCPACARQMWRYERVSA